MKSVMVLSGKGGVGKTAVAGNIAVELSSRGHKVGWLDADLTSSSVMKMIGVKPTLPNVGKNTIDPFEYHGIKIIATSLFTESESMPVFFRGERKREWIDQFLRIVDWGNIKYQVIDCPPGHSDEVIEILELFKNKIDATVIVTTPSRMSLNSVQKTISICRKFGIKITCMVVNYAYAVCPHCDKSYKLFDKEDAIAFASDNDISKVYEVPFILNQEKNPWEIRPYIGPAVDEILKWRLF